MHDQPHDVMTFEEAMTYLRIPLILLYKLAQAGKIPVPEGWTVPASSVVRPLIAHWRGYRSNSRARTEVTQTEQWADHINPPGSIRVFE